MRKYQNRAGLFVAATIPIFVLPARLSEGQWKDPYNLIGSEIVIFLMSLTCWHCIIYIQQKDKLASWHKIAISILCCCVLSNVFFFTFNPFFKDFPFRTATNPLLLRMLMLSSRGVLMSVILIPAAYYIKKDQQARRTQEQNQKLALEKVQIQNRLLEQAVFERTKALHFSLTSLQNTQKELEHQLYIQSRLLASFNHDIKEPFKFSVLVSEKIAQLAKNESQHSTLYRYADELNKSLKSTLALVKNHLEFTKLPIIQKIHNTENVNLRRLIEQKTLLFEGSIKTNRNLLSIHVDPVLVVSSNDNLVGIVIHNLVDNANKYTFDGTITINAGTVSGATELIISNTGLNISEQVIQWFNAPATKDETALSTHANQIQGIGLLLVKEITALLNIGIEMKSDLSGIHVKLNFPNAVHLN